MSSTFGGIQRALTGLQAQRTAMEVAGQNVANANTPGYTRQRTDLQNVAAAGATTVNGVPAIVGEGVAVVGVTRMSDNFLDQKVHRQTASNAELGTKAETLTSVERLLSEPGETGLSAKLSAMWDSWSTLANNPDNAGAREVVIAKSQAAVDALKAGSSGVANLWSQQNDQLSSTLVQVSELTKSVASLNDAIGKTNAAGGVANDLADQRDQLVTRLVELTGATTSIDDRGMANVHLQGTPLVNGSDASSLRLAGNNATTIDEAKSGPRSTGVEWVSSTGRSSSPVTFSTGELAARLDALKSTLVSASKDFDEVAKSLASTVNGQQAKGSVDGGTLPGGAFFGPQAGAVDAQNLTVVISAANIAAASLGGREKDGSNAAAMAGLGRAAGGTGPDAAWKAVTVKIGTMTLAANTSATTVAGSLRSAVADQQSSAGVNVDEETANLLIMQRAYQGAARVLTAVDEALDTLINRTGLVGR